MKLLLITPYYKPAYIYGGPILSIGNLVDGLAGSQCFSTVFTTTANGSKTQFQARLVENNQARVYYFPLSMSFGFFSYALIQHLRRSVNEYEIVHIHTWWNLTAILSLWICIRAGKKVIFSPRGMLSPYTLSHRKAFLKRWFHRVIGHRLLKKTHLHATARQEVEECLALVPNWKYTILPNIINVTRPGAEDELQESFKENSPIRLVFVSRIQEKKGLDMLFQALSYVTFDYRLDIFGDGESHYIEQLRQRAHELGLIEKLRWCGWLSAEKKYDTVRQYDVMVLPSYNENFANIIVEALSGGLAVLTTSTVGLSDYVRANQFGWIAEPTQESLHTTLEIMFAQRERLAYIRKHAPEYVNRDFSDAYLIPQYIDMYVREKDC